MKTKEKRMFEELSNCQLLQEVKVQWMSIKLTKIKQAYLRRYQCN
jgi:hypothetical protein